MTSMTCITRSTLALVSFITMLALPGAGGPVAPAGGGVRAERHRPDPCVAGRAVLLRHPV